MMMSRPALGLIETAGLTGAIQATHAATKAGEVAIASAERTTAGHITVKIEGEWSAVQSAVEAGARAADAAGELISMHVIPRTDNGVLEILPYRQFVARYLPSERPTSPQPADKPAEPKAPPKRSRPKPKPVPRPVPPPAPTPPPAPLEPEPPVEQVVEPAPPPAPTPAPESAPAKADTTASGPVTHAGLSMEELEKMPVVKLRRYARTVEDLPIQGRQISMANKQQLLEAIKAARES